MNQIHPTAIIEDGAQLGDNNTIGPYCTIGSQVRMGNNNRINSHVAIEGATEIGDGNEFFQFSTIGFAPQDMKYHGEQTRLTIGDNNTFREYVSVHRGTVKGGGLTTIGSSNLLMGYVHVAHDCILGNHTILANYTGLSGHVQIDDFVTLGGQNGVIQFVRIGAYSYFGAGTMIDRHIPPYTTGYGNRIAIKGVNIVGLRRKGFENETINKIREAHRIFFRLELPQEEALKQIDEKFPGVTAVEMFTQFIRSVEGGVKR